MGAEADYPAVHAFWERIGAVYDAFGAPSDAINGLANGLPGGAANPSFTGFHLFELQLWTGAPHGEDARPPWSHWRARVAGLRSGLDQVVITPLDYATRAHEILENALQEQVTGFTEPSTSHRCRRYRGQHHAVPSRWCPR